MEKKSVRNYCKLKSYRVEKATIEDFKILYGVL